MHQLPPAPQVTSEGKSSSDDAPSSQEEDVAAEAPFRQHLEDVAAEPPTISQGAENSAAAVQGVALAPQASSADAPAPDEQDECATTDDE